MKLLLMDLFNSVRKPSQALMIAVLSSPFMDYSDDSKLLILMSFGGWDAGPSGAPLDDVVCYVEKCFFHIGVGEIFEIFLGVL